jgi:hypothetical protein
MTLQKNRVLAKPYVAFGLVLFIKTVICRRLLAGIRVPLLFLLASSPLWVSSIVLGSYVAVVSCTHDASGATLVTQDETLVTAFQQGAIVLGFDSIPPNGGGGSAGATGFPIEVASQLLDQFIGVGVVFSSTGGPVGVVSAEGLPNESDPHSPFNGIGGSEPGTPLPKLNYLEPIHIDFVVPGTTTPATTTRVGAWNDPTGSLIQLDVFDSIGNLLDSIQADQGFFVGIENPSIASATFSHVSTQSASGFSLDDVTFDNVIVPEPTTFTLCALGLLGIGVVANRRHRKQAIHS